MTSAKLDRFSWLLYDFANNSFSVMMLRVEELPRQSQASAG